MVEFENLDTYCPYPWTNVYVSTEGEVAPCCVWEGKLLGKVEDIETNMNSYGFCQVRRKMLHGKKAAGCSKCYRGEVAGASSTRLSAQRWLPNTLSFAKENTDSFGVLTEIRPTAWDIRFSNVCNFKCRMCGPQSSTAWYGDWEKLGRKSNVDYHKAHVSSEADRKRLVTVMVQNLKSVQEIYFAGGEPLIMKEHYQILEELIRSKKTGVRIRYNTNLSVLNFQNWDVLSLWKELSLLGNRIEVGVSMDAIGPALEYIRKGCSWDVIQKNLGKLSYNGVFFFIAPTISILNVYRFLDLYKWYYDNISSYRWSLPGVSILGYPECYDLRILPYREKEKIKKAYLNFIQNLQSEEQILGSETTLKAILNYLDEPIEASNLESFRHSFFWETRKLDEIRGENFLSINPEFAEWWNENN